MQGFVSLLLFAAFFYFMMRFGCGAHMVHGHGGHGRASDGAADRAIDPVCHMPVVADQGYTKTHQGKPYRFCSRVCLDTFETNPERYVAQTGGAR